MNDDDNYQIEAAQYKIISEGLSVIDNYYKYACEVMKTERAIERNRVELEKIRVFHDLMCKEYAKQDKIIDGSFATIDKGIEKNDYQLIAMGMQQINDVIKSTPFGKFLSATPIERTKMIEDFSFD